MKVPDDPGITSHKFKCAKLARWVNASQQAIPSRVRSFQKPFPFVFQSFIVVICFLFRKHLGISDGFEEAFVWIALFAFSCVFNVSNVTNKFAPIMRWACASQQAIPSRVREPSKTNAICFQKYHCFDPFCVPEASGHFCWFSGSPCLNDAVCILIRFQCFEC